MNPLRYRLSTPIAFVCLTLLVVTSVLATGEPEASKEPAVTPATARAAIDEMYKAWGRARVAVDKKTLDSIMAPDFYVSLYGKRLSRDKFLSDITQNRPEVHLTRFDTEILTLRKTEAEWTAVISEKIEVTFTGPDGKTKKICSLWVTRDGWRKDGDKWFVTYSEAIGNERWEPGTTPPISNW